MWACTLFGQGLVCAVSADPAEMSAQCGRHVCHHHPQPFPVSSKVKPLADVYAYRETRPNEKCGMPFWPLILGWKDPLRILIAFPKKIFFPRYTVLSFLDHLQRHSASGHFLAFSTDSFRQDEEQQSLILLLLGDCRGTKPT